ncbi:MAG: allantoinase, partial [Gammaproteobacteria bacterium]|nr:allantoinase [Gammaproteobacteria bacterium]
MKFDAAAGPPDDFEWPNGARLALSIVVNVEEGAEMMVRDGDSRPEPVDELGAVPKRPMRVHANESNYRYGIGFGAPRVFGLLEERGIPVTATAAALALERAPALAAHIHHSGHEAACHGYRWVFQHG